MVTALWVPDSVGKDKSQLLRPELKVIIARLRCWEKAGVLRLPGIGFHICL